MINEAKIICNILLVSYSNMIKTKQNKTIITHIHFASTHISDPFTKLIINRITEQQSKMKVEESFLWKQKRTCLDEKQNRK